jgi:PAS domain S-box-containing protein
VVFSKPELQAATEERLHFETLLADISVRFVSLAPEQVDCEIEHAQRLICESLGVDHSSLWQVALDDPDLFLLTHVYRDSDLLPVPAFMSGRKYLPWMQNKILAKEVVWVPNTSEAPPEAARDMETWRHFSVKSALAFPLSVGGGPPIGALSFDSTRQLGNWPARLQNRLQLVAQVFANALDRKHAEQKLRESEARLSLAANSANAGLWTLDTASGALWTTEKTLELFGLPPDEQLNHEKFLHLIHPEDREAVEQVISEAMLAGKEAKVEYRIVQPGGSVRWIAARGRRHFHTPGGPGILMGVAIDITEAKRAEQEHASLRRRLLLAQEEERCRIARELHDDIGQALAILSIEMHRAGGAVSGSPGKRHPDIRQLCDKVQEISHRVSQMSHELHSSGLELLGLKIAIEGACREFAQRHPRAAVLCVCDQVPTQIEKNCALCFFRIVQEALHNIEKHSKAMHVEVRLTTSGEELSLYIADDGCGFDITALRHEAGLGLVSMKERMQLIGGEFKITSNAGEGTWIRARARVASCPK